MYNPLKSLLTKSFDLIILQFTVEIKIEKLHKQAVDAALAQDWDSAIELHKDILTLDTDYTDAYLGLGFAYLQKGNLKEAKKNYRKALDIDTVNIIAQNNIEKINILLKKGGAVPDDDGEVSVTPDTFMHIKGKTRVITLSNIGQADVIAKLKIGEHVTLQVKKRRVEVRNKKGEYIGCLPDDISKRLAFFLEAKSVYETIIKAATKNSVDIFVKEKRKGAKVRNFISFPDNIQEDLKTIMNKDMRDEGDPGNDDMDEDTSENDSEDDEDTVDDLEELAKKAEEEPESFDSDIESDDDEDEE